MEWVASYITSFLSAIQKMWVNPFYYVGLLFVVMQYRKQIGLERRLFHTKLHSLFIESWKTLLWGWMSGLIVSFIFLFVHFEFRAEWIALIWVLSLGLMMIRRTYACIAYSAGLIGIFQLAIHLFPNSSSLSWIGGIIELIASINMVSLLALVGVLHIAESLLLSHYAARNSIPIHTIGKRGHVIGGYYTEAMCVIPLFLVVPLDSMNQFDSMTNAIFNYDFKSQLGFLAFPVMIGFSHFSLTKLPKHKAMQDGRLVFIFGCTMIIFAFIANYMNWFIYIGALLSIVIHEVLIQLSFFVEKRNNLLYVHTTEGLRVLAVIPKSPAEKLGILTGEIIHRVNGTKVLNQEEFYLAMQRNSAFCKLEVVNLDGEIKFANSPLFEDEHYELGIIFAPEPHSQQVVALKHLSLWDYFRKP